MKLFLIVMGEGCQGICEKKLEIQPTVHSTGLHTEFPAAHVNSRGLCLSKWYLLLQAEPWGRAEHLSLKVYLVS